MKPRNLLVIPHYRDTRRLQPFLDDLVHVLDESFSILVSDDGSGEETFLQLKDLIATTRKNLGHKGPIILDPITAPMNCGKGAAVYAGWSSAGTLFDILAFADADGAVSAPEILRVQKYFNRNLDRLDFLAGSRIKMLGRSVDRRFVRHLSGRVFATLVAIITKLQVYDSQCGLKLMKQAVFAAIHPHCQSYGFAFDVEMLLLINKLGYRMEEFAVDWHDVRGSKVSLLQDSLPMLIDIIKTARCIDGASIPNCGRLME
jgi:dolichyl-phosphate beta-glucosyltransferase